MKENDKMMLNFTIGLLVIGIVNLLWAILKSIQLNWSLFNIKGIDILVAYGVSAFLLQFSIRDIIHYIKHGKTEHGADERNIRVLDKSLRNVSIVVLLIMMGSFYYFSLFNDAGTPMFNLASFNWVIAPAVIVFFLSFHFYYKNKNI